jgi:hypothetical protein
MATLNLTVPDDVKALAESQAAERGFRSLDAYFASLIEADRAVPVGAELEQEILAGLATPARGMNGADWDDMRRRFRESRSTTGTP